MTLILIIVLLVASIYKWPGWPMRFFGETVPAIFASGFVILLVVALAFAACVVLFGMYAVAVQP